MCVWSPGVAPVGQTCGVVSRTGVAAKPSPPAPGHAPRSRPRAVPRAARAPHGAAHYNGASPRSEHTETLSQPFPTAFRPITRQSRRRRYTLLVAVILLVSAGVRLWHLSTPADYMFDEIYYAKDAKAIVDGRLTPKPPYRWEAGDEVSWPHPELGKMAIAVGVVLFGDRAFGWRAPSVVAGMVLLACVYPIARRLGLGPPWALLALLFAAADPLGMAQSRIATLDVFVAAWSVLCIYFALRYVQSEKRLWLLFACGAAGGIALATKWSGVLALVAAALILLGSWVWTRRVGPAPAALREAAPEATLTIAPHALGGAGHPARRRAAARSHRSAPPRRACRASHRRPPAIRRAWSRRAAGPSRPDRKLAAQCSRWPWRWPRWRWCRPSSTSSATPSTSPPAIRWPTGVSSSVRWSSSTCTSRRRTPTPRLRRHGSWTTGPSGTYFHDFRGTYRGIVAIGNPFLWWLATAALIAAPILALARRTTLLLPAAALIAVLYLPWFVTSRTSFLYYMTPVAPFMAILVAAALVSLAGGTRLPRRAWLAAAGAALATAVLWDPIARVMQALGWASLGFGVVVGALVVAFVVAVLTLPRLRPARPWVAMVLAGAVIGIVVVFIPVVLAMPISPAHFSRITWFQSWV